MNFLLTDQETERLHFRLLLESDFDDWIPLFYNKDAIRFLGMDKKLSPNQLCEQWFKKSLSRYENKTGGMNVLIDKKTNALIGQCGLLIQTIEDTKRLEIGYSILPQFWRKGYASEASNKCKSYAFENNLTDSLVSVIHPENIGSEMVARKNGMQLEKYLPNYQGFEVNIFKVNKTFKKII